MPPMHDTHILVDTNTIFGMPMLTLLLLMVDLQSGHVLSPNLQVSKWLSHSVRKPVQGHFLSWNLHLRMSLATFLRTNWSG